MNDDIVRNLVKSENWKELIKLGISSPENEKINYLWAWPRKNNLEFLKNVLNDLRIFTILSIGCGTGLLEWIIEKSTGIKVFGIETDKPWWDSMYSIKPFIKLNFLENASELTSEFLKQSVHQNDWNFALLFCYFNNHKAFLEYLRMYKGDCVIIIGPSEGRHTDPHPFQPEFDKKHNSDDDEWLLKYFNEIESTKDFIVVYTRAK